MSKGRTTLYFKPELWARIVRRIHSLGYKSTSAYFQYLVDRDLLEQPAHVRRAAHEPSFTLNEPQLPYKLNSTPTEEDRRLAREIQNAASHPDKPQSEKSTAVASDKSGPPHRGTSRKVRAPKPEVK